MQKLLSTTLDSFQQHCVNHKLSWFPTTKLITPGKDLESDVAYVLENFKHLGMANRICGYFLLNSGHCLMVDKLLNDTFAMLVYHPANGDLHLYSQLENGRNDGLFRAVKSDAAPFVEQFYSCASSWDKYNLGLHIFNENGVTILIHPAGNIEVTDVQSELWFQTYAMQVSKPYFKKLVKEAIKASKLKLTSGFDHTKLKRIRRDWFESEQHWNVMCWALENKLLDRDKLNEYLYNPKAYRVDIFTFPKVSKKKATT